MTRTMRLALGALCFAAVAVGAQEVTLKVHHFLPAESLANRMFVVPWCEKVAKDSANRIKCAIHPSMALGGSPGQLYDQVRDGTADVVWTLPGYTPGRFPLSEVFELPFMMRSTEGTSKALWDYVQQYAPNEFADVKLLAAHVHGPGVFHTVAKPIRTLADLKDMRMRVPTRQTSRFLTVLGAVPVSMPVPKIAEALTAGTIDGVAIPYEVVPTFKVQDLTKFHSETDPALPAFHTATFVFAMNKARYESLPPDLRKVIDANSGRQLSATIGRAFAAADVIGRKTIDPSTINVIPKRELDDWVRLGEPLADAWIANVTAKGADGKKLHDAAKALIARYADTR